MNIPDSLFKYSAYKDYSEKMIKTGSIYLCPGDKLDDQFECLVDWSKYDNVTANKVYNLLKKQMKKKKIAVPDINIQKLYEGNVLNREKARKILKISYKNIKSENVEKFLDSIIIELEGLGPNSINYWSILGKLNSLRHLNYDFFRKTIFECMNLVGNLEKP